jgi:hypothetical protein
MELKYNADELPNIAIMEGKPIVILEGKGDEVIYEKLAINIGKEIIFQSINLIAGYGTGCNEIIKLVEALQPKFANDPRCAKAIVGIIDRDVRPYRALYEGEIDYTQLLGNGLFMLKYYSIETYFATPLLLKQFIAQVVFQPESQITDDVIDFVKQAHLETQNELYYFSLEALKKACDETYSEHISYGIEIKEDAQRRSLQSRIVSKFEALTEFAASKNLSIADIKQICKGKWFLFSYFYKAEFNTRQLYEKCRNIEITQCRQCAVGNEGKDCLYKPRITSRINIDQQIHSILTGTPDIKDMEDIVDLFESLLVG